MSFGFPVVHYFSMTVWQASKSRVITRESFYGNEPSTAISYRIEAVSWRNRDNCQGHETMSVELYHHRDKQNSGGSRTWKCKKGWFYWLRERQCTYVKEMFYFNSFHCLESIWWFSFTIFTIYLTFCSRTIKTFIIMSMLSKRVVNIFCIFYYVRNVSLNGPNLL